MVQRVIFYKLKPEVDDIRLVEMMRATRSILLKVPEILTVTAGRALSPENEWPFTVTLEFDTLDRKRIAEDDPAFIRFDQAVVQPFTLDHYHLDYELDPSKALKYS